MPPQPPERTAPEKGPRHAAGPARSLRFGALTGGTGGFPHVSVLEGETSLGRHRRPESLADPTVLRPPGTDRVAGGRRPALDLAPRSSAPAGRTLPARSPAARSPAARPLSARRARGRHAKAADQLAITVRPLPVVREAAGAVRDWALADNGKRPATGAHRAPGTLPIESWLLIGRHRQQALLAGLVAVGLMLVVLPMRQNDTTGVNPVNAADHSIATAAKAPAKKPAKNPPAVPAKQGTAPQATPASAPPSGRPAEPEPPAAAATPPTSATEPAPAVAVPEGNGPAKSLRTTGSDTVALTFDDGPDPVQTPKILELLRENHVKATFCLVGTQVRRHPDMVRQIVAEGHTLCNHTWNHSLTIGKDKPEKIAADLARTNEAIRAAVPDAKIPFFRAPGGNFTDRLVQTAYADGMTSLYWEVDPRDWEHTEGEDDAAHVEKVVKGVQDHVRPGSIVLSHDFNQPDTVEAYETLLPWLQENFQLGLPSEPEPPVAPPPASAPASAGQ
ncbi:polysaccharide deacetylase family protein [Actinoplanes sp. NPDC049681]|uniref:polysaccharide deacetylase family protein n=1 Tax=Actinoplanes sp. NPDC049681 TaxID=3363905 RepID=UPI003788C63B